MPWVPVFIASAGGTPRSTSSQLSSLPCALCGIAYTTTTSSAATAVTVRANRSLALGLKPRKVGIHENISDSLGLLKQKGLA